MNTPTLATSDLAAQLDTDGLLPPPTDITDSQERARAEAALAMLARAAVAQRITLVPIDGDLAERRGTKTALFGAAYLIDGVTKAKTILYNAESPLARRLWAVSHELGHATLGHRYRRLPKGEADREADTVAHDLCQHFQLPTAQVLAALSGNLPIRHPRRPITDAVTRLIRSGAA